MNAKQAIEVLIQLHDACISKGVYQNVSTVNQVSTAIDILNNFIKMPKTNGDGNQQT